MGDVIPLRRLAGAAHEMSSEALVSAMSTGDTAALGAFYDRYQSDVARFAHRMSGPRHTDLVDDLVQTTFLEAFRSAKRFAGRSVAKTWLFGICANQVRQHIRGEVRRRNAMRSLAAVPRVGPEDPATSTQRSELLRRLEGAIQALPPSLREAYILCALEKVPGKEAARILGIREASLWRRMHDARKALRVLIEGNPS